MSNNQCSKEILKTEDEIKKAIENCNSIVRKSKVILGQECLPVKDNTQDDDITLEKVVRDMTMVLCDLKNGIKLVKSSSKMAASRNVKDDLEELYKKQEEARKKQEEETIAADVNSNPRPRPPSANKKVVKKTAIQNMPIQNMHNKQSSILKKTSTLGTPKKPSFARPISAPNSVKQTKLIVTTVKFPPDNSNERIKNKTSISSAGRPKSTPEQSLRKPALPMSKKRIVSVTPPREVYNPLGILKDEVEKAIQDKTTFTVKGQFPAVRRALLKRGWVEKYHSNYRERIKDEIKRYQQLSINELVELLRHKDIAVTVKRLIKSKLLKDHQVDLYWDHNYDAFKECPDTTKLTLINRFRRESFSYTSKQGLCQAARENHWLQIPGIARINHPRCYVLTKGGDTKTFLKDFGITAAACLLKWVVRNNITGESKIVSETGKVLMKTFDFAVTECYKFIKKEKHQDIDEEIKDALEIEWNEYLEKFYKIVHVGNHLKLPNKNLEPNEVTHDMVRKANYLLNELQEYMPCLHMDGYMNIWILKPINSSRGEGIHICRTLQYILEIIKKNPNRRYIIQKYIERPLLIHDTKFDIRQWFLVSSSYPLTIWMYKQCYLRFSCQTYNLRKLHESIHLTNNSVQVKYMRNVTRDPLLPSYGMWDSNQFKSYLSDIGYPSVFETLIYPGMKQCITGAMIAHRDKIEKRKNCFELYGADFMLSENFEPWLLEINSSPALHASTPVTAKLCPEVLEDVIKVVVDYARNNKASTGNFELIYQETLESQATNNKAKLQVTGTPVPADYFCNISKLQLDKSNKSLILPNRFNALDPGQVLLQTGANMKEALKTLLEVVKKERMKRRARREKAIEVKSILNAGSTQTNMEIISIFENSLSRRSSGCSLKLLNQNISSEEQLSEEQSKSIGKVLNEIASLQNRKQLLTSLAKVVSTLKNTKSNTNNKN